MKLQWLGQAGFVLEFDDCKVVVDPYLSDSLARKYAGSLFEHRRAHPPPLDPRELTCDLVICTHRHTDHMDGETLRALTAANPGLRICVPRAEVGHAHAIGVDRDRIIEMSAGRTFEPLRGLLVTPIPAAHETLSMDANGEHRFLGTIISANDSCIYHSGDCVPYEGLTDRLRGAGIDVALLPVNGRDEYRLRNGVPGNFWIDEALELCDAADIKILIGHHFGLFDFNTVSPQLLDRSVEMSPTGVQWIRPEVGGWTTSP